MRLTELNEGNLYLHRSGRVGDLERVRIVKLTPPNPNGRGRVYFERTAPEADVSARGYTTPRNIIEEVK
jgi:hypothetical protein